MFCALVSSTLQIFHVMEHACVSGTAYPKFLSLSLPVPSSCLNFQIPIVVAIRCWFLCRHCAWNIPLFSLLNPALCHDVMQTCYDAFSLTEQDIKRSHSAFVTFGRDNLQGNASRDKRRQMRLLPQWASGQRLLHYGR